jgi:alpha-ketoglutarate-dependent 2,4-dichlorophenoxyacetate dioxygenase
MGRDNRRWMSLLGNRMWHSDASFKATPAKYSLLAAYVLPSWGGETEFADLRAAYDALPERMKVQIEDLVAEHDIFHSRRVLGFLDYLEEEQRALPPVPQAVVRVHPGSKRKSLYLGSHASHIFGMSVPEGRMLLHDLMDHATRPEFVHTHRWQVGDLVIWDNRCTLHRGRQFDADEPRDMRRTTTTDDGPSIDQKRRLAGAA